MQLDTAEKFLILGLLPGKKGFKIGSQQLRNALVGAILFDLILNRKITIEDKFIKALSKPAESNDPHNLVLKRIYARSKPRKVKRWIYRLSSKSGKYRRAILAEMERKKLITIEERRLLFIPYRTVYLRDFNFREALVKQTREILLKDGKLSKEMVSMLGLVHVCGMFKLIARNRAERKIMKLKTRDILTGDLISKEVGKVISEMQGAVVAAVSTAIIGGASSSS